jgi:hypothetical protein
MTENSHSSALTGDLKPFHPVPDLAVSFLLQPSPTNLRLVFAISGTAVPRLLPTSLHDPKGVVMTAERKDFLWTTTCFELFLRRPELNSNSPSPAHSYLELNASATGDWNVYRFSGYRERTSTSKTVEAADTAPQVSITRVGPQRLDVEILCCLSQTCPIMTSSSQDLLFQPTCVLETNDGAKSYWALHHPAAQPDFHAFHSAWLRSQENAHCFHRTELQ